MESGQQSAGGSEIGHVTCDMCDICDMSENPLNFSAPILLEQRLEKDLMNACKQRHLGSERVHPFQVWSWIHKFQFGLCSMEFLNTFG